MTRNKITEMKMIMKYSLFMLVALIMNTETEAQQKVHAFTVQQAVDYARQNSVQVKNALIDVLMQQQTNRDITSIALPQINGSAGITDYLDIPTTLVPAEFFGGNPGEFAPVKFGTKWNSNVNLTLSQLIFDGQVFIALKARNGTIDFQKALASVTEENIKANVHKIYYQLVLSKTQMELLDANIQQMEKLSHDMQVLYDNGFKEKVEVDFMIVQMANLQTEKKKVQTLINNGYAGLKVLMGMPVKDSLVLTDQLTDDQIKEGVLEGSQYNYNDRKEYQVMTITNKLNGLNVRRYKLSQIPTFSLVGSYSLQAQRNKFDFFGKGDWFRTSYIGLHMNVPIFNGFAMQARKQGARLQLQKSENQTEALKNSIDMEVDNARSNFTAAIATMDAQKKNMELADRVYNQTKKKYEIGTASVTDVNTAQVNQKTAQTNYITALYDAVIAKVDFLKATGKL